MFLATDSNSAARIRLGKGTPRPASHSASTRDTCYILVPVLEGGAAVGPAVLGWSTPSTGHAVRVSARPAAAILMLLPGVVDACVASGALVQNKLHMPIQAQQSRPGPPADRCRRAFRHGQAFTGCAASLPPALRTAVRHSPQARSGRVPPLVLVERDGRPHVWPMAAPPPARATGDPPLPTLVDLGRWGCF